MQQQSTTPFVLTEKQLKSFNSKIQVSTTHFWNGTPCREWTAGRDKDGYGTFRVNGKILKAHRIAWVLAHGEMKTDSPCVLHRCDWPPCCEELHLFTGTHQDNMDDMTAKGRGNKARGKRNGAHTRPERLARGERNGTRTKPEAYLANRPRGSNRGSSKLTEPDIPEIHRMSSLGMTQLEIAIVFSVAQSLISLILQRKIWNHVPI